MSSAEKPRCAPPTSLLGGDVCPGPLKLMFEQFKGGAILAAQQAQRLDDGAWIHPKMHLHPIIVRNKQANLLGNLAADHVDKKARGSLNIGNRKPLVISA